MTLPSKLKMMNLFENGTSWLGECAEVTIPKLEMDMDMWRGGGSMGELPWSKGQKAIDVEWKAGGWMRAPFRQWGAAAIDAVQLRWVGAFQNIQTGSAEKVEIVARGQYTEIDPGKGKPGDDTEQSYKLACVYYRLEHNGVVDLEVDFLNNILVSGGIDRTAELRAILETL